MLLTSPDERYRLLPDPPHALLPRSHQLLLLEVDDNITRRSSTTILDHAMLEACQRPIQMWGQVLLEHQLAAM
jgi:hypothetical protein